MCPSRLTGRKQSAPSRSQTTLDIWSQIQNRRRRNNRSGHLSATYNDHPIQNTFRQQPTNYSKDTQCYGDKPTPIDETEIWRIIGGNVNDIKPYRDMGDSLTILERLRALQVGTIVLSEINVECHKFLLCDNTQSLLQKSFGSARVEYSTLLSKFETTHNKPGGTICASLGSWVHRVIGSGKDETGCGRWSYITYAAKDDMKVPWCHVTEFVTRKILELRQPQINSTGQYMQMRSFAIYGESASSNNDRHPVFRARFTIERTRDHCHDRR
jgi:hypothetical protein